MPDLSNRRVALIGGAGFIGHNLALLLKQQRRRRRTSSTGSRSTTSSTTRRWTATSSSRDLYMQILLQRLDLLSDAGHPAAPRRTRATTTSSRSSSRRSSPTRSSTSPPSRTPTARTRTRFDVRPLAAHARERARLVARRGRSSASSSSRRSMVYGNFKTPEVAEDHPLEPIGHLRRAQARGREDGDRLQPGLRPAVHDPAALGALRAALRQPPRQPGVHRERARRREPARRRRGRREARLLLRRRRRRTASSPRSPTTARATRSST